MAASGAWSTPTLHMGAYLSTRQHQLPFCIVGKQEKSFETRYCSSHNCGPDNRHQGVYTNCCAGGQLLETRDLGLLPEPWVCVNWESRSIQGQSLACLGPVAWCTHICAEGSEYQQLGQGWAPLGFTSSCLGDLGEATDVCSVQEQMLQGSVSHVGSPLCSKMGFHPDQPEGKEACCTDRLQSSECCGLSLCCCMASYMCSYNVYLYLTGICVWLQFWANSAAAPLSLQGNCVPPPHTYSTFTGESKF